MRRTPRLPPCAFTAGMHWNIALCSLSMGRSSAPPSRTASMNSRPDITSASLFASRIRFPDRAAVSDGIKPAPPTIAAMTQSTSGCAATCSSPETPASTSVSGTSTESTAPSRIAAESSDMTAKRGRHRRHCAASRSTFECAVSAKIS